MEKYYIKSLIGEVAEGLDRLIGQGIIKNDRHVILYGLDRYSFAMRTILSNKGINNIECYISDDEASVIAINQDIKNFACRYLNKESDAIRVLTLRERLIPFDNNALIMIASKSYSLEKIKLEKLGYKENVHFYKVCDFFDEDIENMLKNKKQMSLKEMQMVEKDILHYVDALCKKYNLRYWVCGGTLLGTIRHKGFIPWDDDVDIFLPWKDYRKFINVFEEDGRYTMLGMGTSQENEFCDIFAKVVDMRTMLCENVGTVKKINPVGLDVFPLVGLPADRKERHLFFLGYKELNRLIWQDFYANNGDISIFSQYYETQKEYLNRYDFDGSDYVGVLGTAYGERDCTSASVYASTLRLPFEDIDVNAPVGYKEYLDNLYGRDWSEIPDESKRKTHHNVWAYWV